MKQKDQKEYQREDEIILKETKGIKSYYSFQDLNIQKNLLRGLFAYGFKKPSFIQTKAIGSIMSGKDVFIKSPSGAGKLTSVLIGMLTKIDIKNSKVQSFIIVPTRQNAIGINHFIKYLCQYSQIKALTIIGGTSLSDDKKKLSQGGIHVIVGTPGRIQNIMLRKCIQTDFINFVGIVEADQMMFRGFNEQLANLLNHLSIQTQLVLTLPVISRQAKQFYENFLSKNYVKIVKNKLHFQQQYYTLVSNQSNKFDIFKKLYKKQQKYVIYVKEHTQAISLQQKLKNNGIDCVFVFNHQQTNEIRNNTIKEWKTFFNSILITNDSLIHAEQPIINYNFDKLIHYDCPSNRLGYYDRMKKIRTPHKYQSIIYFVTSQNSDFMIDLVYQQKSQIEQYIFPDIEQKVET